MMHNTIKNAQKKRGKKRMTFFSSSSSLRKAVLLHCKRRKDEIEQKRENMRIRKIRTKMKAKKTKE